TTLLGTGRGTKTLAANTMTVGKVINLIGGGVFSSGISPGNLTIKVKLGSVVLASGTLTNLLTSATNEAFQFACTITTRTIGATGTVVVNGNFTYESTNALTRGFLALTNAGATSTIDTTATQTLDITVTYASATGNSITTNISTIEISA